MLVLDTVSGACSDPGMAAIITIVKKFVNMLWIIGPILAMVGVGFSFTKLLLNPEEKKYKNLLRNNIWALVALFSLPTIINGVMALLDDTFEISACWNRAEQVSNTTGGNSHYIDNNKKPNSNIFTDPNEYETGTKPTSNSGSNSSHNSSNSNTSTSKAIFIGDSRTVGMQQTMGNTGDVWSCKTSMGLNWMKSTGVPNVEGQIGKGSAVVVLMGVNDLYQVNSYINYMNSLASTVTQKGGKLYFVSVNPTSGKHAYLNDNIDSFNAKMRSSLSGNVKYIDTNSYLKSAGFSSSDGLHYSKDTYKKIYSYIKNNL